MKGWLGEGERVEADDDGYFGEAPQPQYIKWPKASQIIAPSARPQPARDSVKNQFRHHDIAKHSSCYRAVAVLTQLAIEFGEPLMCNCEF
jgi:hypothetical protein